MGISPDRDWDEVGWIRSELVKDIQQKSGWECFPNAYSIPPDRWPKGIRMYSCGMELQLYEDFANKMEFADLMSLVDKVVQLDGQQEIRDVSPWDLTALLARYSVEECSAVLENARGSGKTTSILVYEPVFEEICARWAISRAVLIQAFGPVIDEDDLFLSDIASFLDSGLTWEETLRMLTFYRDQCPHYGAYVWDLRVTRCALYTALPHDVVPRKFYMYDFTREYAYRCDEIRSVPDQWVPYDLDGFPRPVKIAPRSTSPISVRFDYKPLELENDVQRTGPNINQCERRLPDEERSQQNSERTSLQFDQSGSRLEDPEETCRAVASLSSEIDQHGDTRPDMEEPRELGSSNISLLGIPSSNVCLPILPQVETGDGGLKPNIVNSGPLLCAEAAGDSSTQIKTDQSNNDVVQVVSADTVNQFIHVKDLDVVVRNEKAIKIEDDLDAGLSFEDKMERLVHDSEYFHSPAGMYVRNTIQDYQGVCDRVFPFRDCETRRAWVTLVEVVNVALRHRNIHPGLFMLSSRSDMHDRIDQDREICQDNISPIDPATREAWDHILDFVGIATRNYKPRKTIETEVCKQVTRYEHTGAYHDSVYRGHRTRYQGSNFEEDGDEDDATSEVREARGTRDSTYMPEATFSPSIDREISARIPEADDMAHKPVRRNPTPPVRRVPPGQIWSSKTAGMLWIPKTAQAEEHLPPLPKLERYLVPPPSMRRADDHSTLHRTETEPILKPKHILMPPLRCQAEQERSRAVTHLPSNNLSSFQGMESRLQPKRKGPSEQHPREGGKKKRLRSIRGSTDPLGRGHSTLAQ